VEKEKPEAKEKKIPGEPGWRAHKERGGGHRRGHPLAELAEYLKFAEAWTDTCSNSTQVAVMAVGQIEEVLTKQGQKEQVPAFLEGLLAKCNNQTVRNAIRFALKEAYMKSGKPEKALDQLQLLVRENAGKKE
jgi:hypothetical protein